MAINTSLSTFGEGVKKIPMVFRRRFKCCNPINNTFAITDFFENQFYADSQNDLKRSKNIDKSFAC